MNEILDIPSLLVKSSMKFDTLPHSPPNRYPDVYNHSQ